MPYHLEDTPIMRKEDGIGTKMELLLCGLVDGAFNHSATLPFILLSKGKCILLTFIIKSNCCVRIYSLLLLCITCFSTTLGYLCYVGYLQYLLVHYQWAPPFSSPLILLPITPPIIAPVIKLFISDCPLPLVHTSTVWVFDLLQFYNDPELIY